MLSQKEVEILYKVQVLRYLKARKKDNYELVAEYCGSVNTLSFILSDSSLSNKIYHQAEKRFDYIYASQESLRNQIKKVAFDAAFWWANKLGEQFNTRRGTFAENLAVAIERKMNEFTKESQYKIELTINCDYDPDEILLEALTKSSISLKSKMFSCDEILPRKHFLKVCPEFIEGKEGYGEWITPILP
jgi:hypothetical protein